MPLLFDSGPRIKPEEFRLLRDLVCDFCGIRFPDDMMFVMERKLKERLSSLEIADFAEYYHYLRYHPDARAEIVRSSRLQVAMLIGLLGASLALQSTLLVWCWLLPAIVANPLLRLYLMTEHGGCEHSDDGLANTRTTHCAWPVRLLMWNMPYHAEHHLFPNIPFHALPAAHRVLAPHLAVVADGYAPTVRALFRASGGARAA